MNRSAGVPPLLIWALGVPLILVDAIRDPFWQGVWGGVATGQAPSGGGLSGNFSHLWRAAGEVFALLLLAILASASEAGGGLAVAVLVALWLLFLVSNPGALTGLLGKFTGPAKAG